MKRTRNQYKISSLQDIQKNGRATLNKELVLTGTEISINELPAGVSVPFVHAHKENEEVCIILEGKGQLFVDGEELDIEQGDAIRIDPAAERCFKADDDWSIKFICIQAKANSLIQFTENDAVINQSKPSWLS